MKYAASILYVPDVQAALDFYDKAFGFKTGFKGGEPPEYATLVAADGGAVIAFASYNIQPEGREGVRGMPTGFELWLETDDVAGAYQHAVDHGAEALDPPTKKPWGQVVAYVRDLNGFLIELGEPV